MFILSTVKFQLINFKEYKLFVTFVEPVNFSVLCQWQRVKFIHSYSRFDWFSQSNVMRISHMISTKLR